MDRRQDGTTAAAFFAAGPAPVQGGSAAPHPGHAAAGRATRRGAAERPAPVSVSRFGTATGAATRDTGSARRRFSHDRPCLTPARRRASLLAGPRNATTEILTR